MGTYMSAVDFKKILLPSLISFLENQADKFLTVQSSTVCLQHIFDKFDLNDVNSTPEPIANVVKYYNQENVRSKYQNNKYANYTYRLIDHKLSGGTLASLK